MKKLGVILTVCIVLTSAIMAGVFSAQAVGMASFSHGGRYSIDMGEGDRESIVFSVGISGLYDAFAFDGNGTLRSGALRAGSRVLARSSGSGHMFTVNLAAGQEYELELEGSGRIEIEFMRHAPGRSILLPYDIDGDTRGGILLPGSVGWHMLEASEGRVSIYVTADGPGAMRLAAEVYTAGGKLAGRSMTMADGGCRLYFEAAADVSYLLRVTSENGSAGAYRVRMAESANDAPDAVEIITDDIVMREGDMRSVRARTWPLGAGADMEWASSDPAVAAVNEDGVVTGVSAGTAEISVYAYGGLCATINVTVEKVEPQYIAYRGDYINVREGDVMTPSMQVYPSAAADDMGIIYSSSAPDVVWVSEAGEITALREGEAVITASYGEISDGITVKVGEAPARYRALFISEQNYSRDVNSVRVGAANTAYNLESLFSMAEYDGVECTTSVEIDLTADGALDAIETAFAGAREKDVSIFYISCHGYFRNGMTVMQFVDGSELAACDLEAALRKVPGTVVVIADCCDSGGIITGGAGDVSKGIVTAFAGEESAFMSSKYKVIASASVGQDSYRLGYASEGNEAITVFAWALCDALGWDVDSQRRGPLSADTDYDGRITLWEAYLYTDRRVMWYLSRAGANYVQDVQVYPEGDMFTLFERE